jgi:hypothetical protein
LTNDLSLTSQFLLAGDWPLSAVGQAGANGDLTRPEIEIGSTGFVQKLGDLPQFMATWATGKIHDSP